ncbi:MAG: hypothetical protein AAGN46_08965 [Acidobacteriota bacterium]
MFFESRVAPPPVSDAYAPAAERFAAGATRDALRLIAAAGPWALPGDVLLSADLALAAGDPRRSAAVLRLGERRVAADPLLALEGLRVAICRQRWRLALERLEVLRADTPDHEGAMAPRSRQSILLDAREAALWAGLGFVDRAAGARDRALDSLEFDADAPDAISPDARAVAVHPADEMLDVVSRFELAGVARRLRAWDQAASLAAQVVERAPRWVRARLFLAESLGARGRPTDALRLLAHLVATGPEDAGLERVAGIQAFHLGDHDRALELLVPSFLDWPRPDPALGELLARLPWRPTKAARPTLDRLRDARPDLYRRLVDAPAGDRHVLGAAAMRHGQALAAPLAVATIAAAQNLALDPRELHAGMQGRESVALWRVVETLRRRRFDVRFVRPEPAVLRSLLAQRVPLLGVSAVPEVRDRRSDEESIEIVVGLDEGRGLLHVRDPTRWLPRLIPLAELAGRYGAPGAALVALLPPLMAPRVGWVPEARAIEPEALATLAAACAEGDRERAEHAAEAIADGSPWAARRDAIGLGVTVWSIVGEPDGTTNERSGTVRARLAAFGRRGAWREVEVEASAVLARGPQRVWAWRARAQARDLLGRPEEAWRDLERALELAPTDPALHAAADRLARDRQSPRARVDRLHDALAIDPSQHALRPILVRAWADTGGGREFERALRESVRFLPRRQDLVAMWTAWLREQGRDDLAQAIEAERREAGLVPEVLDESLKAMPDSGEPTWLEALLQAASNVRQASDQLAAGDTTRADAAAAVSARLDGLDGASAPIASVRVLLDAITPETTELEPRVAAALLRWVRAQLRADDCSADLSPRLELQLGALEDAAGDALAAAVRYRRLRQSAPQLAVAASRLGLHLARRGEFTAARDLLREALAGRPGDGRAVEALLTVYRQLDDRRGELELLRRRCRRSPHSIAALDALVRATARERGVDLALELLAKAARDMPPAAVAGVRAGASLATDDVEAAREGFDAVDGARDAMPVRALEIDLRERHGAGDLEGWGVQRDDLLRSIEDRLEAVGRSQAARDMVPQILDVLDTLEKHSAAEATDLAAQALVRIADLRLVEPALGSCRDEAAAHRAIEIVDQGLAVGIAPRQLERLIEWLTPCLDDSAIPVFLDAAIERMPAAFGPRIERARRMARGGRAADALADAEALLADDPEAPDLLQLVAECLSPAASARAEALLERAIEQTGATEARAALALIRRGRGDRDGAIEAFRAIASRVPGQAETLVALLQLRAADAPIWAQVDDLLDRGTAEPALHLAAALEADRLNRPLPESWASGADRRFSDLKDQPGEDAEDERLHLGLALARWHEKRGETDRAETFRLAAGGRWRRFRLGRAWIGADWVPRPNSASGSAGESAGGAERPRSADRAASTDTPGPEGADSDPSAG